MSQDADWNPYAGTQQPGDRLDDGPTTVPHTIGIFNIIIGVILLLCISCYGMQVMVYGVFGSQVMANQQQVQQAMQQEIQKQIKELEEAAENAETEEEAEELLAERDTLASAPAPQMPDMSNMMGMKTPGVFASYIFDCVSGFILNVLMVVSGIGLLRYREWARKMAVWVAGLKFLRILILSGVTIGLVAPAVSNGFAQFMVDATKMNPRGTPPPQIQIDQVKLVYYWMITGWGIALLVLGSIYPLISLRLLTRPKVIAACVAKADAGFSQ